MAADQYYGSGDDNPYTPDTSNGDGAPDWWNTNAPPPAPLPPGAIAQTPVSQIQQGAGYDPNNPNDPRNQVAIRNYITNPDALPFGDGSNMGGGPAWGGPVAPFDQGANPYPTFTPPPLPENLRQGFQLPTASELQNSPGYMERFLMGQQARERGAAARGTILNGGTQQALTRYGQDYASGEYNNLAQQKLGERQQQSQDYLNLAYGPAWQSNAAAVNQYGTLYGQYKDLTANNRTAQNDYWSQQMDLLNAGLRAAGGAAPGSAGA